MRSTNHQLIRLHSSRLFCCQCYKCGTKKSFKQTHCTGIESRSQAPRTVWRSVWSFLQNTNNKDVALQLLQQPGLSQLSLIQLTQKLNKKVSRAKKFLPLTKSMWWVDLTVTEEGIEPNPGPSHSLKVLSLNVSSFRKHKDELLLAARKAQADVVLIQELNIGKEGLPSLSWALQAQGWHIHAVPKPQGNERGGVAILTRDPWACLPVQSAHTTDHQIAMCAVGGPGCPPLRIITAYRLPDSDHQMFDTLQEWMAGLHGQWILAGDFNLSKTPPSRICGKAGQVEQFMVRMIEVSPPLTALSWAQRFLLAGLSASP